MTIAQLPILMYHSVTECPPDATRALSVRPVDFARQLRHLRSEGFTGLTFGDLADRIRTGAPLPERTVVLTFDDGYADVHREALPLLAEHGFPATVFVTTGWLDDAGTDAAGRPLDRMLSWREVGELDREGIEIGAHSHSHEQLDQLAPVALRSELRVSKKLLEDHLGCAVPSLAYPFGYSSRRVRDEVETAGYRQAASVANAAVRPAAMDPYRVPRLTVRRSTSMETFSRVVTLDGLSRIFAVDRALTRGWSCVRRTRSAISRIGSRA